MDQEEEAAATEDTVVEQQALKRHQSPDIEDAKRSRFADVPLPAMTTTTSGSSPAALASTAETENEPQMQVSTLESALNETLDEEQQQQQGALGEPHVATHSTGDAVLMDNQAVDPYQPQASHTDFDVSAKLREMGEISFQPVSKEHAKKPAEEDAMEEVSITKKTTKDHDDQAAADDKKKNVSNLRKNIREVIDDTKLDAVTLAAQREEQERLNRVQEQQRQLRVQQRQADLDKAQSKVLSLLQGNLDGLEATDLMANMTTPSVRVVDRKTGEILEEVRESSSIDRGSGMVLEPGEIPPDQLAKMRGSPRLIGDDDDDGDDDEEDDDGEELEEGEVKPLKKNLETIAVDSSDDDCIMLSDEEEDDDGEPDDPHNSGMHVNDTYNVPDAEGRVLINFGHSDADPDVFVAPQIARIIKPHQIGGIRFMYDNIIESLENFDTSTGFGCILAHSMGLGKTLQLICFCDIFLRHTSARTVLCIMPINTLQNWLAEFNMWLPEAGGQGSPLHESGEVRGRNFKIFVLNDSQKSIAARSKVVLSWAREGGVLLIGYELYRLLCLKKPVKKKGKRAERDPVYAEKEQANHQGLLEQIYEALVKPGPDLVVCDEGHRIKNSHASTSVALKQIRTKRRIVLTGYPLQNNLIEYWCMVDFVRPNYLGTKTEFCNMFEKPIQNGQCIDSTPHDMKLMRYRAHVLHSLLLGFVQRRSHLVLQASLPQKEEYVMLVRMTEFQRKLYDVFMNEVVRKKAIPNPLKAFAVCCKIWNHPDVLYNFLKKREADLDLELEEAELAAENAAAAAAAKKRAPKKSLKANDKDSVKSEVKSEEPRADLKGQEFNKEVKSEGGKMAEPPPPAYGYNNYQNQPYANPFPSYDQTASHQYPQNGYYYNNAAAGQQYSHPNYYHNNNSSQQYYGQGSSATNGDPTKGQHVYWNNESSYYNQPPPPPPLPVAPDAQTATATNNYYNYGNPYNQQYVPNPPQPPVLATPQNAIPTTVTQQQQQPPAQEAQTETVKVEKNETEEGLVEVPDVAKLPVVATTKEDGIPYEWAVELMKDYVPDLTENSPKMKIFFCILEESLILGDRILVFSQSLLTLNLIERYLKREKVTGKDDFWAKNINYFRLDGSTSACDRERLINEFNVNVNIPLFLVSTRAGSLGINLVGANRVIVFDASWNPCHDTQAVCRVYRYGQQKRCYVYRLVMDNCLEKRIYDRQVNKQGMSDRVVDECNPDAHLSIKEVTNLCWDNDEETEMKDFADIIEQFTDLVMQKVLVGHSKSLSKEPFRHESLLVDRKEKKLSMAEKRLAQRGYELEKQASSKPIIFANSGKVTQYRVFRTADGALVHRPVASVLPLHTELAAGSRTNGLRWIPAEVWQRQGMVTQETILPADVSIPSSSSDKSGGFILKAGQKVMILKSNKGIYMQLETGKIIAIRTGIKPGGGQDPALAVKARPFEENEVIKLDDDDDDEVENDNAGASGSGSGDSEVKKPVLGGEVVEREPGEIVMPASKVVDTVQKVEAVPDVAPLIQNSAAIVPPVLPQWPNAVPATAQLSTNGIGYYQQQSGSGGGYQKYLDPPVGQAVYPQVATAGAAATAVGTGMTTVGTSQGIDQQGTYGSYYNSNSNLINNDGSSGGNSSSSSSNSSRSSSSSIGNSQQQSNYHNGSGGTRNAPQHHHHHQSPSTYPPAPPNSSLVTASSRNNYYNPASGRQQQPQILDSNNSNNSSNSSSSSLLGTVTPTIPVTQSLAAMTGSAAHPYTQAAQQHPEQSLPTAYESGSYDRAKYHLQHSQQQPQQSLHHRHQPQVPIQQQQQQHQQQHRTLDPHLRALSEYTQQSTSQQYGAPSAIVTPPPPPPPYRASSTYPAAAQHHHHAQQPPDPQQYFPSPVDRSVMPPPGAYNPNNPPYYMTPSSEYRQDAGTYHSQHRSVHQQELMPPAALPPYAGGFNAANNGGSASASGGVGTSGKLEPDVAPPPPSVAGATSSNAAPKPTLASTSAFHKPASPPELQQRAEAAVSSRKNVSDQAPTKSKFSVSQLTTKDASYYNPATYSAYHHTPYIQSHPSTATYPYPSPYYYNSPATTPTPPFPAPAVPPASQSSSSGAAAAAKNSKTPSEEYGGALFSKYYHDPNNKY